MNYLLSKLCPEKRKMIKKVANEDLKSIFKNGIVCGIEESKIKGTAMQVNHFLLNKIIIKFLITFS